MISFLLALCIPNSWVCDNVVDCFGSDGSDEENCDKDRKSLRTEDLFQAKDNQNTSKTKDGKKAKDDCEEDSFACKSDGHCFPKRFQCDGRVDCHDGSDEGKSQLL